MRKSWMFTWNCRFLTGKLINFEGIKRAKKLRIDAQYYSKTENDDELQKELKNAKTIVNDIINIISKPSAKEIKEYRNRLLKLIEIENIEYDANFYLRRIFKAKLGTFSLIKLIYRNTLSGLFI